MLFEERLEAAERRRLEGNSLFAEGKLVEALGKYAMVRPGPVLACASMPGAPLLWGSERASRRSRASQARLPPLELCRAPAVARRARP
jgi:hypothetical protein